MAANCSACFMGKKTTFNLCFTYSPYSPERLDISVDKAVKDSLYQCTRNVILSAVSVSQCNLPTVAFLLLLLVIRPCIWEA